MSEDAPQFPPPAGEQPATPQAQEATQIPVQDGEASASTPGDDPSAHDTDLTHPRGNIQLAEEMAYAEKADVAKAISSEQMAEQTKNYIGGNALQLDAAEVARARGDRRAEAVRQDYFKDHPELVHDQTAGDERKEATETAELIHPETLQAIKDLMSEIPANGRGNRELYYYDPELKIGIKANYNNSGNNEGNGHLGVGVYTARELQHLMPYGDMGDYFKMREPELARAVYEASLTWSAGGRERMLQDEKDKFVQALTKMGVPETDDLSERFQRTLDTTGGNGLSSESDLAGYGWSVSGRTVEDMKTLGYEVGGGRQPGYMPGETYGVPAEQTAQTLKELIQRGVNRLTEREKAA